MTLMDLIVVLLSGWALYDFWNMRSRVKKERRIEIDKKLKIVSVLESISFFILLITFVVVIGYFCNLLVHEMFTR